uniref:Uncharacterized protein n=1 Tax=Arundo donax TaxID=35708 RepID=A0A0A9FKG5_ARUDO
MRTIYSPISYYCHFIIPSRLASILSNILEAQRTQDHQSGCLSAAVH